MVAVPVCVVITSCCRGGAGAGLAGNLDTCQIDLSSPHVLRDQVFRAVFVGRNGMCHLVEYRVRCHRQNVEDVVKAIA